MGRSGQYRFGTAGCQCIHVEAVVIDRQRERFDTVVPQHHSMKPEPGVLHRQRRGAQCLAEQCDGLCRAGAEDDVSRIGQDASGAAQIVRDRDARRKQPLGCDVSECVGLDVGQPLP